MHYTVMLYRKLQDNSVSYVRATNSEEEEDKAQWQRVEGTAQRDPSDSHKKKSHKQTVKMIYAADDDSGISPALF